MGRAGGGNVGGGFAGGFSGGGGHRSFSHGGGGHRSGGSTRSGSRAGSSASTGPSRVGPPPRGFYSRGFTPPIIINNRRAGLGGGCLGNGCLTTVVVFAIICIVLSLMFSAVGTSHERDDTALPVSTYNREKLENSSWTNDCVIDEIGWISEDGSVSGLERQLREFYDLTGVQPFVYLKSYDPALQSDSDKASFASDFYDSEIDNSYTFAFFYFEEERSDDVGYMYYEGGSDALSVMDAEAVEIFWTITDQEWYSSASTEDCLANMFVRTAERIMTKSTTKNDIYKIVAIIALVIIIAVVIIVIMDKRRKNEKERNEETRRILETPLE